MNKYNFEEVVQTIIKYALYMIFVAVFASLGILIALYFIQLCIETWQSIAGLLSP